MSSRRRASIELLRTAGSADRKTLWLLITLVVVAPFFRAGSALWLRVLIDGATSHSRAHVLAGAIGFGVTLPLSFMLGSRTATLAVRLDDTAGHYAERRLAKAMLNGPYLDHYFDPESASALERLRAEATVLGQAGSAIAWQAGAVVSFVASTAVFITVQPLLLLFPIVALPAVLAQNHGERLIRRADATTADRRRLVRGFFGLCTGAGPGKEIRIFDLGALLVARAESIWTELEAEEWQLRRRAMLWSAAGGLLFGVSYFAAISFVGIEALHGRASAGDLVVVFVVGAQLGALLSYAMANLPRLMRSLGAFALLLDLEDRTTTPRLSVNGADAPQQLRRGIVLSKVSFAYPGHDEESVRQIDLELPAGAVVALVGENGAGKSTLVSLLSRLYKPTSGCIQVDGVDLQEFDIDSWRARLSGGFQDYARFEFTVRDSIGLGDVARIGDPVAVSLALERASVTGFVDELTLGIETPVGPTLPNGVGLSGGQWQKIALGRAMIRDAPLLLMLDEPTASLDPESEHRLFSGYADAGRHVSRQTGGITLLVTHRFSTIRMADLIVVLDDGRIVEVGNHRELIAGGGLYAELYGLQVGAFSVDDKNQGVFGGSPSRNE